MKYDVFISYRHDGGFELAKHLHDLLSRDGYIVSFDIDTLRNGDFDKALINNIENCQDFILIVDSNAFDRIFAPSFPAENDWMRQELAHALILRKNIVPIFLEGVIGFPANLPEDIAAVTKKNASIYNKNYFNDFYRKLKEAFLTSKSNQSKTQRKKVKNGEKLKENKKQCFAQIMEAWDDMSPDIKKAAAQVIDETLKVASKNDLQIDILSLMSNIALNNRGL
ncbi:MAG: TIR domain-containing protein [Clostridium sp.]|nr:TIR domain-containing protein [Clostridium sp.]